MFFYFCLVFVFFMLFAIADCKQLEIWQRRIICAIPFILLFLVSAFRFDVGYDYFAYYGMVTDISDDNIDRLEPLSYLFVLIARYFEAPYLLFILFAIPTYLPVFWFSKQTGYPQLAFWIFVFFFWLDSFGIIRQAAAMGIILIAFQALFEKNFIRYLLLCILASLFHMTALIMLPIYFVYYHCSWKSMLLIMIISLVFLKAIFAVLIENELYVNYLLGDIEYEGGTLIRFFYIGLGLLMLYLSYSNKTLDRLKEKFVILIPSFFFPFMLGGSIGGRLSLYFYMLFIYLIPVVLSHSNKKIRMVVMSFLCLYFFMLLYVSAQNTTRSPNVPYQHIFEVDLENPTFRFK